MSGYMSLPPDDEPHAVVLKQVITSGMPLATGLRAYAEECPYSVRSSLLQLAESVESGQSIGDAIQNPGLRLPAYLRGLVEGGIRTGSIGPMLDEYMRQRRLQKRFGQRVTLDLAYPIIVTYFSALIGFCTLVFLVPQFEDIFTSFAIELPWLTATLIDLTHIAQYLSIPLSIGFVVSGMALLLFLCGGRWSKALIDRIPFFGTAARYASMSEFCSLLAPLVETSVPLPTALQAVATTMQPSRLKSMSRSLASSFDGSHSLSDAASSRKLPREITHVLKWEGRGRAFGEILRSWAELFARMAQGRSSIISAIIGPIMMLGIGFFVGLIVIALFLPLVRLMNVLS